MTAYGQQLKTLREAAGVSLTALALRLAMGKSRLSERESGVVDVTEADFMVYRAALDQLVAEREAAWVDARYQRESGAA